MKRAIWNPSRTLKNGYRASSLQTGLVFIWQMKNKQ